MEQQEQVELLRKYADEMKTSFSFHIKGDIPSKKIDNAVKKFAGNVDRTTIIGMYDTTVLGSGKEGYIFTDTKVYYLTMFQKPKKLWYDDISSVEVVPSGKKDCDNKLKFTLYDGTVIEWTDTLINKTPLCKFFREMIAMIHASNADCVPSTWHDRLLSRIKKHKFFRKLSWKNHSKSCNLSSIQKSKKTFRKRSNEKKSSGAISGGVTSGTYGQVNKSYDEEKFHARQGHGFAAERANHLFDRLTGHDAKIVGDDNIKNGADRIVDGVTIQSKYCKTGRKCITDCFDKKSGDFRYMMDGKPMQIEVPSDKFDAAVQAMEEKIREGKIPSVTDPNEAKNIVRRGHFTYQQAKNIAKAGTVESLTYDAVSGSIIASSAFGVSALITFATNVWNGEDFDKSLKLATYSGLKVGGTAFITTILASQFSKMGLNSALVGSSEAVTTFMGPKASAVLINAFRYGSKPIYGAAATKSAAKLLRGNAISAGITVIVLSSFDIANIFRGRISGKQLFKNFTNTATTVAGGTGGLLGGAAIGTAILPGVGTAVGGFIGSIAAGAAAGKATDAVLGTFIEDDADEMVAIIQKEFEILAQEYLLNQKEAEKSVDRLGEKLDGKMLKDMFASKDRSEFARNILIPIIENETKRRKHIAAVSDKRIMKCLKEVLESISDSMANNEPFEPAF